MATYYEIDSSRATLREYSWETKNPLILSIAMVLKLFRHRVSSSCDDAVIDSISGCVVPDVAADLQPRFAPVAEQLARLGFLDPVYHVIEDVGTCTRLSWATFRHVSGQHCARIHHRYWGKSQKSDRGLFVLFITSFTDNTMLVSSAGKPDVAAPASVEMNRMPNASVESLWTEHERRANAALVRKGIQPVHSRDEVLALSENLHIKQRDFHLARKFFRPRSAAEESNAAAFNAKVCEARAAGMEHPEVVAELLRLQEKKPRWTSALWVLALSAIAFLAAGSAQWDWKFTLWLIPILLIHELGHWVAMRLFNYRNLRMFFIPFFGAAVTGQNWNVPGWKKAIVSLAGPLPGIGLGISLGVAGIVSEVSFLKQAGLMFILINAFNLLPVLPLDGGHFLHATLFCRNRWLDISFRALAVVALLVMSIFGLGKLMMGIGIMLAIALPVAFKMGKLTDQFRKMPLPEPLPGEDRIPAETARTLIGAVKRELPAASSNAVVAQHTLNVFETLNARPPGALATVSLLLLYGGSVIASVLCGVLLFISKQADLGDFFKAAIHQPELSVACNEGRTWKGATFNPSAPVNLLVTTLDEGKNAAEIYDIVKEKLPPVGSATLFGRSLLLAVPTEEDAVREEWYDYLQQRSTNTFVIVSNNVLNMSLNFIAPNAVLASNLAESLNLYFDSPNFQNLTPPWDPRTSAPEYKKFLKARKVWQEAGEKLEEIWNKPVLAAMDKDIVAAQRRGATKQVTSLQEAKAKEIEKFRKQALQDLQKKYADTPYSEVISLHGKWVRLNYTNNVEREDILKELREQLGSNETGQAKLSYGLGGFTQAGLIVQTHWLTLPNPSENLPAILSWLCQQKCTAVKYGFRNYSPSFDDFEEDEE